MERTRTIRALKDGAISCGAVLLLVTILLAMDGRVREQVSHRFATREGGQAAQAAGTEVRDLAGVVYDAVRDRTSEHNTLTIFVVAATVLVVFMVRT